MLSKCGMKIGAVYQMAAILSRNVTLKNLDLSHNNLHGGHSPKTLNNLFNSNKCLESINFNESMLCDSNIKGIAKGFTSMSKLQKLQIAGCQIEDKSLMLFCDAI